MLLLPVALLFSTLATAAPSIDNSAACADGSPGPCEIWIDAANGIPTAQEDDVVPAIPCHNGSMHNGSSITMTAPAPLWMQHKQVDALCKNNTNGPASRACWTEGFDINTDFDNNWPDTGVTRKYNFEITNGTAAPDGNSRITFLINGQYPGPTIFADWGDKVEVTVTNHLESNGTGIHWHGIRQWNNCWADGVPGLTECPLAPGQSKTYKWHCTQYGSSWYHSHVGVQYGDGVVGMMIINGPTTADYDKDLGMLPVSDWYYQTASARSAIVQHTFGRPPTVADNGLVNGTMVSKSGTGRYAVTTMQQGKKYKLRLINMAVDNHFVVSLDNHNFTVVAADFVPIQPYTTTNLFIAIGQRYDVIIDADQPVENYWFRAEVQDKTGSDCGRNANNGNIKSIFHYKGAPSTFPHSTGVSYKQRCDDEVVVPYWNSFVPKGPIEKGGDLNTSIQIGVNAENKTLVRWGINMVPMKTFWDKPILAQVLEGNDSFTKAQNVITLDKANEWYYWLIQEVPGTPISIDIPHPMHLHGHDFYVLGSGIGNFSCDGSSSISSTSDSSSGSDSCSSLKYHNPIRRDTAMLPAGGWVAVAFKTDNPGSWLMHCHIAWHVEQGMAVQFLETADLERVQAPVSSYQMGCREWNDYYPRKSFYHRGMGDSGV